MLNRQNVNMFKEKKMLKKLLVSAVALASLSTVNAASISGTTDFKVKLPEILILYHWDQAYLDLTKSGAYTDNVRDTRSHTLQDDLGSTTNPNYDITQNPLDVANAAKPTALANEITVKLSKSWGIRTISDKTIKLTAATQNTTLTHITDASSTMTVKDTQAVYKGTTAAVDGAVTVSDSSWATPVFGDIVFKLNLANAKKSGDYTSYGSGSRSDATDTFKITLSSE